MSERPTQRFQFSAAVIATAAACEADEHAKRAQPECLSAGHRAAADRYRIDEQAYTTPGRRIYDLATEEARFYRLGGEGREGRSRS
jgi:hypothetical protein